MMSFEKKLLRFDKILVSVPLVSQAVLQVAGQQLRDSQKIKANGTQIFSNLLYQKQLF